MKFWWISWHNMEMAILCIIIKVLPKIIAKTFSQFEIQTRIEITIIIQSMLKKVHTFCYLILSQQHLRRGTNVATADDDMSTKQRLSWATKCGRRYSNSMLGQLLFVGGYRPKWKHVWMPRVSKWLSLETGCISKTRLYYRNKILRVATIHI